MSTLTLGTQHGMVSLDKYNKIKMYKNAFHASNCVPQRRRKTLALASANGQPTEVTLLDYGEYDHTFLEILCRFMNYILTLITVGRHIVPYTLYSRKDT